MQRAWLAIPLLLACAGRGGGPFEGRVVDLTHPFDADSVYWPTGEGFQRTVIADGPTPAGYTYRAGAFCAAEHGGTHLDAPSHFARDGASAEAIPPERLLGPGIVVDASARCSGDPGCRIGVADLEAFEARHGRIPGGAIVLLRTGWGRRWPDRSAYLGTAERGEAAVAKLRFPGLGADAARWLAERGVPIFENVAALDELPETAFYVIALPMKIGGGSGGPLRIVAILGSGG